MKKAFRRQVQFSSDWRVITACATPVGVEFAEYEVPAMTTREIKELAREINALQPPEINELLPPHGENKQRGGGVKHG